MSAQRGAWNWYFGTRAGITFQNGDPEPLFDGMLSTIEGCATQSEPGTGNLLFYTDGVTVWNRFHEPMPNGTGLYGDASTSQSALIVPAPGSPGIYYIFNAAPITSANLNGRCFCLYYSVVDLRRENGFGDVVRKNVILIDEITEHLTGTQDCLGEGFWIVARSRTTRHFYSFHFTRDGLSAVPVVSDASNPSLTVRSAGQMHISPEGKRLVITSVSSNSQLYDFNAATGKVTNGINLFPNDPQGAHYGAAFTPDGRFVYIAVSDRSDTVPLEIFRFRTDLPSASQVVASRQLAAGISGTLSSWIPMQLAPDGRIYIGRPSSFRLSAIRRPSALDIDSIQFVDTAISLTGRCQNGLPNFMGTTLFSSVGPSASCRAPVADFSTAGGCEGTCFPFIDESTGDIESWLWTFEGANPPVSTFKSPARVCFDAAGTYRVRLIVSNGFGSDTMTKDITVLPRPDLAVSPELSICRGSTVRLVASGATSYHWSPAALLSDTTSAEPIASPTNTTLFTVIGRSPAGCLDTATILVRVPVMEAGQDQTICRGDAVRLTASGAASYAWQPTVGLSDPTSATPVASPQTTTSYVVTMQTDSCVSIDTVVVNVVDTFRVRIAAPQRVCADDTVRLDVMGGGTSFRWEPAIVFDDATAQRPRLRITQPTMVRVTARSGACVAVDSVMIDALQRPVVQAGPDVQICPGDTTRLRVTTSATSVRWTPSDGLDDPTSRSPLCVTDRSMTYVVEAFDDASCVSADTLRVIVRTDISVSAGPDKAICRNGAVQLSGIGPGGSYQWSPSEGLSDPLILSPIAAPTQTTTYVLTARIGSCIAVDTMTVYVSTLDLSTSRDTTICNGQSVRLLADGGASRFSWSPAESLSDPSIANPIASPRVTTTYLVSAEDQYGCRDEATITVRVRDTIPIRLRIGTTSADAGRADVGVPIFVDVDPALLPITIDELRAELECDLSVFLPNSAERGNVVIGRTTDGRRVTILTMRNIQLLATTQRLTTLRGLVLLGEEDFTPVTWQKVSWTGEQCPSVQTFDGTLFVSGCFIRGRIIRQFAEADFNVIHRTQDHALDIVIRGSEPGEHIARIVTTEGRVVWQGAWTRPFGDATEHVLTADVGDLGSGCYLVQLLEPFGSSTMGLTLLR